MDSDKKKPSSCKVAKPQNANERQQEPTQTKQSPQEFYGPEGPEPTRYGDWEQKGRCTDF